MPTATGRTQRVTFDGRRVTFRRRGALAALGIRRGRRRLDLREIAAVRWKPAGPLGDGHLHITVPGRPEPRRTTQAATDRYSAVFSPAQQAAFATLRTAIDRARTEAAAVELARIGALLTTTGRQRLTRVRTALTSVPQRQLLALHGALTAHVRNREAQEGPWDGAQGADGRRPVWGNHRGV